MTQPKFNIGTEVEYVPFISGMDSPYLTVDRRWFVDSDPIYNALGITFIPSWFYGFEGSFLTAKETDLKLKDK